MRVLEAQLLAGLQMNVLRREVIDFTLRRFEEALTKIAQRKDRENARTNLGKIFLDQSRHNGSVDKLAERSGNCFFLSPCAPPEFENVCHVIFSCPSAKTATNFLRNTFTRCVHKTNIFRTVSGRFQSVANHCTCNDSGLAARKGFVDTVLPTNQSRFQMSDLRRFSRARQKLIIVQFAVRLAVLLN